MRRYIRMVKRVGGEVKKEKRIVFRTWRGKENEKRGTKGNNAHRRKVLQVVVVVVVVVAVVAATAVFYYCCCGSNYVFIFNSCGMCGRICAE